jgi:hypothetical protein
VAVRNIALLTLALAAQLRLPQLVLPADPATDLVRVRAMLTTTSTGVDLSLDGAEWANAISPDQNVRVIIDGRTIHVTRKNAGEVAIQLELILGSVRPHTGLTWTLTPVASGSSRLDLSNLNSGSPVAVDHFDAGTGEGRFTSLGDSLRAGGPLGPIPNVGTHMVVAFFYPWYNLDMWSHDPRFYNHPVPEYATDNPADLQRLMTTAKSVGIDALVMSWSGKDYAGGIDHQRMLRCLSAAQAVGFKMAALLETTVANPAHVDGAGDMQTVLAWLIEIYDDYASQPSYLRAGGRPVVMAYAAQRMSQADWSEALRRLRASGRDVLLIGEGSNNTRLGGFDGQFYYASKDRPGDTIDAFDRAQALNVRTYHLLLGNAVGRRIWVATVSPGYDDTHLDDGRVPRVSDRAGGQFYGRQWQAALDNRADWIAITSWNEYLENTEIEATALYGNLYLTLTRTRTGLFRSLHRHAAQMAK